MSSAGEMMERWRESGTAISEADLAAAGIQGAANRHQARLGQRHSHDRSGCHRKPVAAEC